MVVAQNSSGQLFFDITPLAPRIFVWKPYNASVLPSIFHDRPPKIAPDPLETTTAGTLARIVSPTPLRVSSKVHQEAEEETSAQQNTELISVDKPKYAALKVMPVHKQTQPETVSRDYGQNVFYHASKVAEIMEILGDHKPAPNLTTPQIHKGKKFNSTQASNDSIVYAKDEISLTQESSRLYHIRQEKLRARRQITLDITTELNLSNAQLNSLKAQVN